MSTYWTQVLRRETSRRRFLSASAGLAGAAAIAACGGGGDSGGTASGTPAASKDRSGLLTTLEDTRSKAKQGGIWTSFRTSDFVTLDAINSQGSNVGHTQLAYSTIATYKPGSRVGNIEMLPEAAESWEFGDGGTKVTFKLRQNVKLDPRAPTNGRNLTAQDWIYTWDTFTAKSPQAGELVTKIDPNAPIESWSMPDARTVVFKLAYPWPPFLPLLNHTRYGLVIMPVEHDGKYDARVETRGSGPFMMTKWDLSSRIEWRRNPGYWDAPRPYLDGIDQPLVSEYAARLAQYKAGNLWEADVRAEDILAIKAENPKINVYLNDNYTGAAQFLAMDYKPGSAFHDIRVRRGMSMLYDRDLAMRTFRNVDGFAKAGIDIAYKMHTLVSAADSTYWTDPTGNELGAAAQYLRYNPAEATKLLDAAGIKNLRLPYSVQSSASPENQAVIGMLNATGHFNFVANIVDPGTYVRTIFQPKGVIDGVAPVNGGASQDPDLGMTRHYATSNYTMFTGPLPFDDLLRRQQRELDVNKRKALWKEIHLKWAENLMDVTGVPAGLADVLETAQPWFANRGALVSPLGNTTYDMSMTKHYWYDESKRT